MMRTSNDLLIIIGAGGHSQDIIDVANSAGYTFIGYLDDVKSGEFILGKISDYSKVIDKYKNHDVKYSIGINDSKTRKLIDIKLMEYGAIPATLIHSSAIIGHNVSIGDGVVLGPGSILTSNVKIGRHVHLNTHASVNQGSSIGDYSTLSPGVKVCGDVIVGECVQFGANSTIINLKTIGNNVILGAGTVVVSDIPSDCTVIGIPGKIKQQ
jgi:acetyltransferase EpsM